MENRTKIKVLFENVIYYEATLVRPDGSNYLIKDKNLNALKRLVNSWLVDGYTLVDIVEVEHLQVA